MALSLHKIQCNCEGSTPAWSSEEKAIVKLAPLLRLAVKAIVGASLSASQQAQQLNPRLTKVRWSWRK